MDEIYYEILKKIQDYRDKKIQVYWSELSEFNKGNIKYLISEKYITSNGVFALTEKGTSALLGYLNLKQKSEIPERYIFDTCVFNRIIDGKINCKLIEDNVNSGFIKVYITHIQNDEIQNCKNDERRKKLSLIAFKLKPTVLATESFILGKSRLGYSRLGDGDIYNKINTDSNSHANDALIGETAIKNNLTLVSDDKRLVSKVLINNGKAIFVKEFIRILNNYGQR